FVATEDSYLYERLCRAGFITIGRTNVPEFGSTITTEPLAYGPARNPWNTDHSTGGSSGGSAATVAAGCVAVAHANDGGGSIRIPASECGLVGLKPSKGRVSLGPALGESWIGGVVEGCVTRSVRDTAAVMDAISGYEPGDPNTPPPPARAYVSEVGARDGSQGFDVLVTPTLAGPPPKIGALSGDDSTDRIREIMQYTAQFNMTGQPAISLPLHMSADGLPMGVQFVGAPYREDLLLRLAAQLETAAPWSQRRPAVHA
ncbi:MAG: amidase, partial [Acidimicrobiia bacterium]|nr:amidase [Acidimicrobiia bacterium]